MPSLKSAQCCAAQCPGAAEAEQTQPGLRPITIANDALVPPSHLVMPACYKPFVEGVLLSRGFIQDRVRRMAIGILEDYVSRGVDEVQLVCLLKGSRWFMSELLTALGEYNGCRCSARKSGVRFMEHYVTVSSYENTSSTGQLKVNGPETLAADLKDQHVLLVEDIIDTGTTLKGFKVWLQRLTELRSLAVAALLEKRTPQRCVDADYAGFSIPDKFVIGCSLDYNQHFRDLPHICVINAAGIEKFKKQ